MKNQDRHQIGTIKPLLANDAFGESEVSDDLAVF